MMLLSTSNTESRSFSERLCVCEMHNVSVIQFLQIRKFLTRARQAVE